MAAPARLYLLGGSALLLLGNPRPTLDLDYLGEDINKTSWQNDLDKLGREMHINLDPVPLHRFIPIPVGATDRHIFYQLFGLLEVYIFDPYAIAISKIERGFDTDISDVVFLIQAGQVELNQLEEMLSNALKQSSEYDMDEKAARQHFELVRKKISES
jgi:hypothetical protein